MNIDDSPGGLDRWSLSHAAHHDKITEFLNATAAAPGIGFFILDPINRRDTQQWLLDHQESHNLINSAFGISGNDLQDVDFADPNQVRAWLDLNFAEHQTWGNQVPP
jgi:hypothetical protein